MPRSVVLMSGGVASAVLAGLAADEGEAVWLHVDYGQRATPREAAAVEALAARFHPASVTMVQMPYWRQLGDFALLAQRDRLPDAMAIREGPDPAWIPGLMASLVAAGSALASETRASVVYVGAIEDRGIGGVPTNQLYPDRSREFVAAWNWQFEACAPGAGKAVRLEAPLIASSQGGVMLLAQRLGIPFENTWSCYRAGPGPCGRCLGCAGRAHGFSQLRLPDPLLASTPGALQT